MEITELIKQLKEAKRDHINPYNLGDMGKTGKLIDEAIKRFEELIVESNKLNELASKFYAQYNK